MVATVSDRVRQFVCRLHGHEELLKFEAGRLSLTCSCGWQSEGIATGPEWPKVPVHVHGARILRLPDVGSSTTKSWPREGAA